MGPVRKYRVTVNGAETVMKLNEHDARAYPGAALVDGDVADVEETAEVTTPAKRRRQPANKARTAADKGGE
jgi:hypothetical protein